MKAQEEKEILKNKIRELNNFELGISSVHSDTITGVCLKLQLV